MYKSLTRLGFAVAVMLAAAGASAQAFPNKPLTLIVPFAPGASADGIARIVGRELAQVLGQPVVVDNKPGAGGALGLMMVAKAPADGYTLGLGATGAIAVNPHLPDAPPLNPRQDLLPLGKLADIPLVFVTSSNSGYGNLQAFINASRKTPGGLSYANAGQYTAQHLSGELLANMAAMPMVGVPYRGSGPAVTDLLGGMVPAAMVDLTSAYPHIKAGKLVALGVTKPGAQQGGARAAHAGRRRRQGLRGPAWMGLFLPAKTPADVRTRLSAAMHKVMANPAVQSQIQGLAAEPVYLDSAAFGAFIAAESAKWAAVIARIPKPAK
jgi:tripartite-type tricarboxylate transporter receptor subunit TctC